MKLIKKLVILTGKGCGKGTVAIEKNAVAVSCRANLYSLRNLGHEEYLLIIIAGNGTHAVRMGTVGTATRQFTLPYETDISELHCAVSVGEIVALYGTTEPRKMWESNIIDIIRRHRIESKKTAFEESAATGSKEEARTVSNTNTTVNAPADPNKNINNYFLQILSDKDYNDEAIAEVNYYSGRHSQSEQKNRTGCAESMADVLTDKHKPDADGQSNVSGKNDTPLYENTLCPILPENNSAENAAARIGQNAQEKYYDNLKEKYGYNKNILDNYDKENKENNDRLHIDNPDNIPSATIGVADTTPPPSLYGQSAQADENGIIAETEKTDGIKTCGHGSMSRAIILARTGLRSYNLALKNGKVSGIPPAPSVKTEEDTNERAASVLNINNPPESSTAQEIRPRQYIELQKEAAATADNRTHFATDINDSNKKESYAPQRVIPLMNVPPVADIKNAPPAQGSLSRVRLCTFYEQIKDQVDDIFKKYTPAEDLQNLIPDSKWVKVDYNGDGKYYVIGVIGKPDYICYGVPAVYTPDPPQELDGYCQWLPLDIANPENKGYWLLFQDAVTGDSIKNEIF